MYVADRLIDVPLISRLTVCGGILQVIYINLRAVCLCVPLQGHRFFVTYVVLTRIADEVEPISAANLYIALRHRFVFAAHLKHGAGCFAVGDESLLRID